jgi:transposase-like protein
MSEQTLSTCNRYQRIIELRQREPQTRLNDFCRKHGISPWTYYFWRKRLAERESNAPKVQQPAFVAVATDSSSTYPSGFEIVFPTGVILRSTGALSRQILQEIVSVLGS